MKSLALTLALITLAGCTSARVVSVIPNKGGVVAMKPTDSPEARLKAEALMRKNCPTGFVVTEEGEAVIGHSTREDSNVTSRPTNSFKRKIAGINFEERTGGSRRSTSSTTRKDVEWRLKYKCSTTPAGG